MKMMISAIALTALLSAEAPVLAQGVTPSHKQSPMPAAPRAGRIGHQTDGTRDLNLRTGSQSIQPGVQIIDVTTFDVAGDNMTDDTAAFQRAADQANALGNAIIRIPQGAYRFPTGPHIVLTGDVAIVGDGRGITTINSPAGGPPGWPVFTFAAANKRRSVQGITFVGPNSTDVSYQCLNVYGGAGSFYVRDCDFINWSQAIKKYSSGISPGTGPDDEDIFQVESCYFSSNSGDPLLLYGGRLRLFGNFITSPNDNSQVYPPGQVLAYTYLPFRELTVEGNTFSQSRKAGLRITSAQCPTAATVTIKGNIFADIDSYSVNLEPGNYIASVSGNTFMRCGEGVRLSNRGTTVAGNTFEAVGTAVLGVNYARFANVATNTFKHCGAVFLPYDANQGLADWTFSDNLVVVGDNQLAWRLEAIDRVRLSHNTVTLEGTGKGLVLYADSADHIVSESNEFRDIDGARSAGIYSYGNPRPVAWKSSHDLFARTTLYVNHDGFEFSDLTLEDAGWSLGPGVTMKQHPGNHLGPAVASAGTITIPPNASTVHITGTATITNIALPPGFTGPLILIAESGWRPGSGGNLLASGAPMTPKRALSLWCDSGSCYETGRGQ